MEITVEKITPHCWINEACRFTSGKHVTIDPYKMYRAEHSPIRTQLFAVCMYEIPTYVSTHFARHKHGVEHFVKSNRKAKEPVDRNTPVNHMMFVNAQALINMSRVRLCHKSDAITRQVMQQIQTGAINVDADLGVCMVPNCDYRGFCPEMKSCGKVVR